MARPGTGPFRTAEVKREETWVKIEFEEIRKGDTFRLIEPDGTILVDEVGRTEFEAISETYWNEDAKTAAVEVRRYDPACLRQVEIQEG